MDDLDKLLSDLHTSQGEVVSSGRFTLDLRKAREKLRRFQLAEPCFYLMKILQAAVSVGAERVDVQLGRRSVRFVALLPPGSPFVSPQALVDGLQDPQALPPGPVRHLAIGLNSAWAVQPAKVTCACWSVKSRSGWQLTILNEEMQLDPLTTASEQDRLEFTLERDTSLSSYVRSVASEHVGILHRCAFCPVPLYLDSRRVVGQWSRAEAEEGRDWMGGPYHVAERILADPAGGFQICAPPWKSLTGLLNRTEKSLVEGAPERRPTFSFQGDFTGQTDGETVRARLALALPVTLHGRSRVVLVKDGVTLEALEPLSPRLRSVGLQALIEAGNLPTDLSEFTAVQGEALGGLRYAVDREARLLVEEALKVVDQLPRHRIALEGERLEVGCAWLMGSLTLFGLPVVWLLRHYAVREQNRKHSQERDRLRAEVRSRLTSLLQALS